MVFYGGNKKTELLRKYIQNIYCKYCDENTEHAFVVYCKTFVLGLFYPIKWWASDKNAYLYCKKCQRETAVPNPDEPIPQKIENYYNDTKIPFGYKLPTIGLISFLIGFGCLILFGFFSVIVEFMTPINTKLKGKWENDYRVYNTYIYDNEEYTIIGQDTIAFGKYTRNGNVINFPFMGGENEIMKNQALPLVLRDSVEDKFSFNKIGKIDDFDVIYKKENNAWRAKSNVPETNEQIRKKVIGYLEFEKKKFEKDIEVDLDFINADPNAPVVFAANGIQVNFYSVDNWRYLFNNDESWEKANEILHSEFPGKEHLAKEEKNLFKRNADFLKAYIQKVRSSDLAFLKRFDK